ncbi:MAG: 3'-5' exonuclease, partial [Alphaproteobacteria bacterium]|nr:3'-5' exonuclease [Alphaproteobacteria bacterium]
LVGEPDDNVRAELGDGFPKLPLHSIVCIGALVASRRSDGWAIEALGAPHIGERTEAELIASFVAKIDELQPKLVTFSGSGFDLPVLRYRAMVHSIAAPGLRRRPYFNRFSEDAIDLCDVLASFTPRGRAKLDELAKVFGLPGKPDGIDGSQVETYVSAGRIREVADYCESDVVNTYRIWLRYELFRGILTAASFASSEENLAAFMERRGKK